MKPKGYLPKPTFHGEQLSLMYHAFILWVSVGFVLFFGFPCSIQDEKLRFGECKRKNQGLALVYFDSPQKSSLETWRLMLFNQIICVTVRLILNNRLGHILRYKNLNPT